MLSYRQSALVLTNWDLGSKKMRKFDDNHKIERRNCVWPVFVSKTTFLEIVQEN